jgi:hypothetical protein
MKNSDANRFAMVKTTREYLTEHSSIWQPMTPFVAALAELDAQIAGIESAARKQETPSGAAAHKAAKRDALEDVAFLMCQALSVLAHDARDKELSALCDVTPSDLAEMDEQSLSNRTANVLAAANTRKTELETLQVTQENLDEFTQALSAFNAAKTKPREATAARKVQTESLPLMIQEALGLLRDRIDPMVNLFSRTNPEFVAGYRNARMIIDRAATRSTKAPSETKPEPGQ